MIPSRPGAFIRGSDGIVQGGVDCSTVVVTVPVLRLLARWSVCTSQLRSILRDLLSEEASDAASNVAI